MIKNISKQLKKQVFGVQQSEASFWCSAKCLRQLFCTLLLSNNTITPENIWNTTWKILSTDILCNERKKMDNTSKILFYPKKVG